MMTPRTCARTRRTVASLVVFAAGLAALAGCDPRTLVYFLQPNEPTVYAKGPALKGKKVVVVVHAVSGTQGDFEALDRDIAREVADYLRKNGKKVDVVDNDRVWSWVDDHPTWTDPAEVAKALEADVAIFLEVEHFEVTNPLSPGMLEGVSSTHVQAYEWDYPKNSKGKKLTDHAKEAKKIYDNTVESHFPRKGATTEGAGLSRSSFRTKFLKVASAEIAWEFVDHSPEDEIVPDPMMDVR